jgi:hypothetical protein
VCRRWRCVVFQSPRRLNLRVVCTPKTRTRRTLDIWPPLPLIVREIDKSFTDDDRCFGDIIAALEHNDRVCQIELNLTYLHREYDTELAAMQKPFPELTDLRVLIDEVRWESIFPDSFLGGTTPRLRSLYLRRVPFPGLPKLRLSATHLVDLDLSLIPPSGYIPPEVMATSLSALTSLKFLQLGFRYPRRPSALESRRPPLPPLTHSILPSLTGIWFTGASEYLAEILARIDTPQLNKLYITFFGQFIFDHTPQLFQLISQRPTLRAPEKGYISFNATIVDFTSQTSDYGILSVEIQWMHSIRLLASLGQVCTCLPRLSMLEDLYLFGDDKYPSDWQYDVENTLWLDLLRSFVAVKNLYLSEEIVPRIAPTLQELVGRRTTEVLPTLENIFLEGFRPSGPLHEGIEKFVAARRLTSHPVAVSPLDKERHLEIFDW